MTAETRVIGRCNRCGAPVYVQTAPGAVSGTVEFSCDH